MTWRYIAQRITTGEFLDWDVPMTRDELTWQLSGSGSLRGSVSPDVGNLRASDGSLLLDEWGTALYAEKDGEIRWGGIVVRSNFNGPAWEVEAAGFGSYPYGIPYLGDFRPGDPSAGTAGAVEPLRAFREIWRHVQSYPDSALGVTVVGPDSTPVLLGDAEQPYTLRWFEAKDCGSEMDTLAKETPFDYAEQTRWDGDNIAREIIVGYPRLGTRRDDLAFVQGDNVTEVVSFKRDGDDFANEVVGLGAGEGDAVILARVPRRDGRLRRPFVYTDKSVSTTQRMTALSRAELEVRSSSIEVSSITVIDHPNAVIGSWSLGDDIAVRASVPWLGEVEVLSRITSWSLIGEDRAQLSLARSDSFRYGG